MTSKNGIARWMASPYLHLHDHVILNPHTGRGIAAEDPNYAGLRQLILDEGKLVDLDENQRRLADEGWLIREDVDLSHQYRIRWVSLEAHSVCNQRCFFCPVSIAPRESYFMPTAFYERIVREIADLQQPIEAVAMIQYNEPTVDRRFIDQVRCLLDAGLPPAVFSNGTGLTPQRIDALVELGGLDFLSVNLSTLDRQKYKEERQADHLEKVLANLDYAKDKPVAREMVLTVLNDDPETLQREMLAIARRFEGSRFKVQDWEVNDRAGNIGVGLGPIVGDLRGCDYMGSRPIEHVHITAAGRVVLCCQDYEERWVAGDLNTESLVDILDGPAYARMRRLVYGLEPAPANFLCSGCRYAIRR